MPRGDEHEEEGSTMLLTIGYAMLALAVSFVCVCATSLYLAQKQLDGIADAAALAASDGFVVTAAEGGVTTSLDSALVESQATSIVEVSPHDATLVRAMTIDGSSARVTVAATWEPPLIAWLLPARVELEATATARSALAG